MEQFQETEEYGIVSINVGTILLLWFEKAKIYKLVCFAQLYEHKFV